MNLRRHFLLGDDEFILARADVIVIDAVAIAHIAKADRLADRVAIAAAGEVAGKGTIAQDRLAAEKDDIRIERGEADELLRPGELAIFSQASRPRND